MSSVFGRALDLGFLNPLPDSAGVVHQDVVDLIDVKEAGQGFRIKGNHILLGDAHKIVDRRPQAIELMDGEPIEVTLLKPTRILPRNRNKYDHRALECERVRRSLAKEKGK